MIVVIEGFYAVKSWRIQIWDGVVETFNLDRNEYREKRERIILRTIYLLSIYFDSNFQLKLTLFFVKLQNSNDSIYIYSHVEIYKNAIIGVELAQDNSY